MSGMTGSLRYMAPEVATMKNYNESCDTYSFAILLWQMMSLQIPYSGYSLFKLDTTIWREPHVRPEVDASWPIPIKLILQKAWDADIKGRSSMQSICAILREEAVAVSAPSEEDHSGLEHEERPSTFVFFRRRLAKLGGN
jgi:serine/threonine protein kinase